MNKIRRFFDRAKEVAEHGDSKDAMRRYRLGAIGVRDDGVIVSASNISTRGPHPHAHSEVRLTKKLNVGSIVYVVRITRDGKLCSARPCHYCRTTMKMRGVKRCFYSINEQEYGVIEW